MTHEGGPSWPIVTFTDRHFPVRPNLEQLKHQAKDLLRAIRQGDPSALAELQKHHPKPVKPETAKLADAQLALARSYGLPSWPRLVIACRMTDAIWRGDADTVRELVLHDPRLLHEDARGRAQQLGAANVVRRESWSEHHHPDAPRSGRGRPATCFWPRLSSGQD